MACNGHTLGTAPSGHISKLSHLRGPALPFMFGPSQVLHLGDLDFVAHGRLTPVMTFDGRIPEDIHGGGPISSFAAGPDQLFHHGNMEPRTFDKLTSEAAPSGRI